MLVYLSTEICICSFDHFHSPLSFHHFGSYFFLTHGYGRNNIVCSFLCFPLAVSSMKVLSFGIIINLRISRVSRGRHTSKGNILFSVFHQLKTNFMDQHNKITNSPWILINNFFFVVKCVLKHEIERQNMKEDTAQAAAHNGEDIEEWRDVIFGEWVR